MRVERTFAIVKPDMVKANKVGAIINHIEEAGFSLVSVKKDMLNEQRAGEFYGVHKGREFYDRLVSFMSSGPIVVMILEKENAVKDFRELIGSTNPKEAKPGTIRHSYASTVTFNAIHGSDSLDNANMESDFFFTVEERF